MVFAMQGPRDRSEIEMTLELRTLWFDDLKKQDPQTSKNKYIVVNKVVVQSQKQFFFSLQNNPCLTKISHGVF